MVLVLERAGAAAAAVQCMRGLLEPVGLGTERQHMFMASSRPPSLLCFSLSFSLSSLSLALSVSLCHSLSLLPPLSRSLYNSHLFLCTLSSAALGSERPGTACGQQHGMQIKGRGDPSVPQDSPHLTITTSPSPNGDMLTHASLSFCHLAYDQRVSSAAGNLLWA